MVQDRLPIGHKLEAISQRIAQIQTEIAALKRDVSTILHLLQADKAIAQQPASELENDEPGGAS